MSNTFSTDVIEQELIKRIDPIKEKLHNEFMESQRVVGFRYSIIDDLLPPRLAEAIYGAFKIDAPWREMKSFRERKLTSKDFDSFPRLLGEVTFALQSESFLKVIEEITGIKDQIADPSLYAGGLSMMRAGDFLDPHIDNSHDQTRSAYRRLNLLYYVTPNWKLEDGGNLELWNKSVTEKTTLASQFNRLVIMETNHFSWHSVSKVVKKDAKRCCVSSYNFSKESPLDHEYYHVTSFHARPEDLGKKWVFHADNLLRSGLRILKKGGFGKKDVYEGTSAK